jgi:O-antigen/teichoic acid export membrane protein
MQKRISNIFSTLKSNEIVNASILIFLGQFAANFFNYLYNIAMGRVFIEDPSDYGDFFLLSSILNYALLPIAAFIIVLSKVVAEETAVNNFTNIKNLYNNSRRWVIIICIFIMILGAILTFPVSKLLKIDSESAVFITFVSIAGVVLFSPQMGFLSGMKKFLNQSILNFFYALIRIIVGVSLALFLGVFGAISGSIFGGLAAFIIGSMFIYKIFKNSETSKGSSVRSIQLPKKLLSASLASTLFFGALITVDLIFIKNNFTDEFFKSSSIDIPGIYSSINLFGRIIFFLASTFGIVVVPLASYRKAKKQNTSGVLFHTLLLSLIFTLPILLLYFLFPADIIRMVYGEGFIEGAKYLGLYGISMMFYSLSAIINNYFISIGEYKHTVLIGFVLVLQLVSLTIFGDVFENYFVIQILINLLLFILLGFYWNLRRIESE